MYYISYGIDKLREGQKFVYLSYSLIDVVEVCNVNFD
jgi:hypothetical protein